MFKFLGLRTNAKLTYGPSVFKMLPYIPRDSNTCQDGYKSKSVINYDRNVVFA